MRTRSKPRRVSDLILPLVARFALPPSFRKIDIKSPQNRGEKRFVNKEV